MKCELCGYVFNKRDAVTACKHCPMIIARDCSLIRCPNCGFEITGEPQVVKLLNKIRGR